MARSWPWSSTDGRDYGSEFLFPVVLDGREKGNLALTPAPVTTTSWPIGAAGMEDKFDAMHFFRVGGAASRIMDATTMDVSMNTWNGGPQPSHADTYCGGNSVHRSGGIEAFSRTGVYRGRRPIAVRRVCTFMYSVPSGQLTPNPLEAKVEGLVQ